jgi:hypothetical protein
MSIGISIIIVDVGLRKSRENHEKIIRLNLELQIRLLNPRAEVISSTNELMVLSDLDSMVKSRELGGTLIAVN